MSVPRPHASRLDPSREDYEAIIAAHEEAVQLVDPATWIPKRASSCSRSLRILARGTCCDQRLSSLPLRGADLEDKRSGGREVRATPDRTVGNLAVHHVDALCECVVAMTASRHPWRANSGTYGNVALEEPARRGGGHCARHVRDAVEDAAVHFERGIRVRRRPSRFEAAPLIDRDVDQR